MIEKDLFKNVHYQTQLLESLGWDENQLEALYEYLGTALKEDNPKSLEDIEKNITDLFGAQVSACFTNILNEVMFSYNMHTRRDDYEN